MKMAFRKMHTGEEAGDPSEALNRLFSISKLVEEKLMGVSGDKRFGECRFGGLSIPRKVPG
jgi:hypothetical protein